MHTRKEVAQFSELKESLQKCQHPSEHLPDTLKALWYDANGDWISAHYIAQNISGADGSWVHAYLHRKEGDLTNARYWYRQANRPEPKESLHEEWGTISKSILSRG